MKPIETRYRGYRFRSRLEARWAVAFDAMGLPWEYEPEGFVLDDGTHYLPDFRVRFQRFVLWVEVKPMGQSSAKWAKFMEGLPADDDKTMGTVLHDIPDPVSVEAGDYDHGTEVMWPGSVEDGGWDDMYMFCACQVCGEVGFAFEGRGDRIGCECGCRHHSAMRNPKILRAYAAARAARFEHEHREAW